jgi:hypothetical protein
MQDRDVDVSNAVPGPHALMVEELAKSGEDIKNSLTTKKYSLLHEAVTRTINTGALLDQVKKQVINGKNLGLVAKVPVHKPDLTSIQCHLLHMAIGIAGEAAELLQEVAHHAFLGHPLDEMKTIRELGDIAFYEEGFRQGMNVSRDTVLDENINKLRTRYPEGYSDAASQQRADTKA